MTAYVTGLQFDKQHAITVVATAPVQPHRFVSYSGAHASTSSLVQCISETAAETGDAFSGVTGYSYPVEASQALILGDYVKPASDGSGRAAKGIATDHCARALHAVAPGRNVECELVHRITE